MASHDAQRLVHLAPEVVNDLRVLREPFLLPAGDRLKKRNERRGRGDVHARPHPELDEPRVLLPCGAEEALVGKEHDHVVGTVRCCQYAFWLSFPM